MTSQLCYIPVSAPVVPASLIPYLMLGWIRSLTSEQPWIHFGVSAQTLGWEQAEAACHR